MNISPTAVLRLFDAVRDGASILNSEIVAAMADDRFEIRNIAVILAERRGIQVVALNDSLDKSTEKR